MLKYNIDYSVSDDGTATVGKIGGYGTTEQADKAKAAKEGFSRLRAESANDVASLGFPIQRALYAFKASKVPEGMDDSQLAEAIWVLLNPVKKDRNSGKKDLPNSSTDGISSTAAGDDAGQSTEGQMATKGKGKKGAAKKKAAKKTTSKGTGARGAKTLLVKNMLLRKNGCTRGEILKATGWPTVSVQAMAKAAGLKLRVEKVEKKPKQYFGTEKA